MNLKFFSSSTYKGASEREMKKREDADFAEGIRQSLVATNRQENGGAGPSK